MKIKRRTKIAWISVVLLCLFACSFCVNARTKIDSITFPETVESGKTFEINVSFRYEWSGDRLYGDTITLYYAVGTDPVLDYTQRIIVKIDELDNAPKPTNVIIKVDLSTITHAENDIFLFRIKYAMGSINSLGEVYLLGTTNSEMYELTIVKAKGVSISALSLIIPILFLSVIVLMKKKK